MLHPKQLPPRHRRLPWREALGATQQQLHQHQGEAEEGEQRPGGGGLLPTGLPLLHRGRLRIGLRRAGIQWTSLRE